MHGNVKSIIGCSPTTHNPQPRNLKYNWLLTLNQPGIVKYNWLLAQTHTTWECEVEWLLTLHQTHTTWECEVEWLLALNPKPTQPGIMRTDWLLL